MGPETDLIKTRLSVKNNCQSSYQYTQSTLIHTLLKGYRSINTIS